MQGRDPQPRLQGLWPTQAPGGADSGWSLPSPAGPEHPVPRSLRGSGKDKTGPARPQRGNERGGDGASHVPGRNWTTGPLLHSGARGFEERKPEASASRAKCVSKPALFKVTKARPSGVSWMRRAFGKHLDERPRQGVGGCRGEAQPPLIPGCGLAAPQRTLSVSSTGWRGREDLPGPPRPH